LTPLNTFSKKKILRAARTLARSRGIDRVTKKHIAQHLGCAMGTVNHHCKTMELLREEVLGGARDSKDFLRLLSGSARAK
jgi:AcrR family transcriptional regulator